MVDKRQRPAWENYIFLSLSFHTTDFIDINSLTYKYILLRKDLTGGKKKVSQYIGTQVVCTNESQTCSVTQLGTEKTYTNIYTPYNSRRDMSTNVLAHLVPPVRPVFMNMKSYISLC